MQQLPLQMRLRERAVFDSFVSGANAAAVAQLRAAVGKPGAAVYWLAGPAGVGKSHLLQSSCALALAAGHTALYLPLSQLLRYGPAALESWQGAQVVALDELDLIVGQRDWEQAVFALYREAEERGATLLAAAAAPPALQCFALADLGSRFAAAMLLVLQPLDEPGQRQALQWRARARGLELPAATARYLQRRFRRDLPTLCTLLDTLDAAALQAQRRLTVPFIRQVLAPRPAAE